MVLLVCLVQLVGATEVALIGGFHDGLAMGLRLEDKLNSRWHTRYGIEGSTGEDMSFDGVNPLILYGGFKYYFDQIGNRNKVAASLGITGYSGDKPEYGLSTSIIFESLSSVKPIYFEIGLDFLKRTYFQAEVGYKF